MGARDWSRIFLLNEELFRTPESSKNHRVVLFQELSHCGKCQRQSCFVSCSFMGMT